MDKDNAIDEALLSLNNLVNYVESLKKADANVESILNNVINERQTLELAFNMIEAAFNK